MAVRSARSNYDIFLECFSHHMGLFHRLNHSRGNSQRQQMHRRDTQRGLYGQFNGDVNSAAGEPPDDEPSQFECQILVDNFATRMFMALPQDLRTLSSTVVHHEPKFPEPYSKPYTVSEILLICSHFPNDLEGAARIYFGIAKDANIKRLYVPIVCDYVKSASQNHGSCEICKRDRFKLTEHHLIPRTMHGQSLKQGLYSKHKLNQVAWLCRGCHEFVHQRIKPKVLANKYSSVELLLRRDDVREWAKSIGKIVRKVR